MFWGELVLVTLPTLGNAVVATSPNEMVTPVAEQVASVTLPFTVTVTLLCAMAIDEFVLHRVSATATIHSF